MKTPAKLHVYNANEPGGECIIVGNRNGLLKLSEQLQIVDSIQVSFDFIIPVMVTATHLWLSKKATK